MWFLRIRPDTRKVIISFIYFFSLMTTYFMLRPVRDEMGIQAGIENMQWLFTGTFIGMMLIVPVFGWITRRYSRNTFIPVCYGAFLLQVMVFYVLFRSGLYPIISGVAFFIWLSVFNLFIVSIFWSFMSDLYDQKSAKKHYATIAAGGTLGALSGPGISVFLISHFGMINLLLVASLFMLMATGAVLWLSNHSDRVDIPTEKTLSDNIWSAIPVVLKSPKLMGIALFILLYTSVSTFLYFQQAEIVSNEYVDPDQRTTYFALRDMGSNIVTLILQFFITKEILNRFGLVIGLTVIPAIAILIFIALGIYPGLYILAIGQILYRGGNYAIQKPSREILFTEVSPEERYRGKNFIDTAVYRGGDAISGWFYSSLASIGLGLSSIALLAVPIALVWMLVGKSIARSSSHYKPEFAKA